MSALASPFGMGPQLRFSCPMCGTALEIPWSRAGTRGPCPVCAATIIAPTVVHSPKSMRSMPTAGSSSSTLGDDALVLPETDHSDRKTVLASSSKDHVRLRPRRLYDLPPRPSFRAGTIEELKDLPALEGSSSRRAANLGRGSVLGLLRRERGLLVLLLVLVAVGLAFVNQRGGGWEWGQLLWWTGLKA